eukprot:6212743-Pleurochrysis_carterae.AAC.1
MRPASLDSTASHAAFAQLTLLHSRRLCAAVLSSPCRVPARCVLNAARSLASVRAARPATRDFSPPRAKNNTTNKEVRSPHTSPPRVEPSMGHAPSSRFGECSPRMHFDF